MTTLKLLIIADIHYSGAEDGSGIVPKERKATYGCEFLDRIRVALLREGMPDGIVLLGDVINDGTNSRALNNLKQVKHKLDKFGIPLISLTGISRTWNCCQKRERNTRTMSYGIRLLCERCNHGSGYGEGQAFGFEPCLFRGTRGPALSFVKRLWVLPVLFPA